MGIERVVRIIAGAFVLLSLVLAWRVNGVQLFAGPTWLWFTAFVGLNLFQSGITGWCLMEDILRWAGLGSPSPTTGERLQEPHAK